MAEKRWSLFLVCVTQREPDSEVQRVISPLKAVAAHDEADVRMCEAARLGLSKDMEEGLVTIYVVPFGG